MCNTNKLLHFVSFSIIYPVFDFINAYKHIIDYTPPQPPSQSSSATTVQHQPTYVNMTELATMAANKITNNVTQQQAQPLHSPVLSSTSASSLVSPDSSATNPISSMVSSPVDISAAASACSLQTPQNMTPLNSTPQTPLAGTAPTFTATSGTGGGGVLCSTPSSTAGDGDSNCSIQTNATMTGTTMTSASATTNKAKSNNSKSSSNISSNNEVAVDEIQNVTRDNDCKSAGSVLEKANIFENLEKQQIKQVSQIPRAESIYGRKEEIYKSNTSSERDSGTFHVLSIFFYVPTMPH